jgi:LacI family transcriptional regulator
MPGAMPLLARSRNILPTSTYKHIMFVPASQSGYSPGLMIDPDFLLRTSASELNRPIHMRVRQLLRKIIIEEFKDGQKFYSERDLIEKLKFSQPTIRRALVDLANEGFLTASPRRGFFVRKAIGQRHVGLISPPFGGSLSDRSVEALAEACSAKDYALHLYHAQRDETPDQMIQRIGHKQSEERLILMGFSTQIILELDFKLRERGFRSLVIGGVPDYFSGDAISIDHAAEPRLLLDHLLSLGHRRIVFMINEPRQLLSTNYRAERIEQALRDQGLTEAQVIDCRTPMGENSFQAAYNKMPEILAMTPRPTAVVPLSGVGAWAVQRFLVEKKMDIPGEISLFCFDPIIGTELLPVPLTGFSYSYEDRAKIAIDLLWQKPTQPIRHLIQPDLIIRASTGPAPE